MTNEPDDNKAHDAGLSRIEAQIMSAIAAGASDREIALQLFLYEEAVRQRFRSIILKLGARDRAQAIAVWRARHESR